ncbi:hypothetical protein T08_12988 [Trichinella sp. T8]|nr:hypothetical protein T08_12988 [Trichinella sp. T8]
MLFNCRLAYMREPARPTDRLSVCLNVWKQSGSLQASIFVLGRSLQKEQQQQQQPEKRKSIFTKPEEALREKSSPSVIRVLFI